MIISEARAAGPSSFRMKIGRTRDVVSELTVDQAVYRRGFLAALGPHHGGGLAGERAEGGGRAVGGKRARQRVLPVPA